MTEPHQEDVLLADELHEGYECPLCLRRPNRPIYGRWEDFFPWEPPSVNVRGTANRAAGRFDYKKSRDTCVFLARAWMTREAIPAANRIRRVTFTRLYVSGGSGASRRKRGSRRDAVNNSAGHKPLLDALHLVGLLTGDTEFDVEDLYRQERVVEADVFGASFGTFHPGVLVRLEELRL